MPQVLRYPEFGLLQILRYPELYLTLGIRQVVPVVTKVGIAPQVTLQRIDILFALRAGGFDQNEQWLLILLGSDVLKSGSQLFQGLVKFTSDLFTRFFALPFPLSQARATNPNSGGRLFSRFGRPSAASGTRQVHV